MMRAAISRYARPAVDDGDVDLGVVRDHRHADPPVVLILDRVVGVAQQVQEHLRDLGPPAQNEQPVRDRIDGQRDTAEAKAVVAQLDRVLDDGGQQLGPQRVFVALARERPQRVDDAANPVDRAIDVVRRLAHSRDIDRVRAREHVEALGAQQDRRQRVVDLVGDAGAHLAERGHLGGGDGGLPRFGELALGPLTGDDVETQRSLDARVLAADLEQREEYDDDGDDERIHLVDAEERARRGRAERPQQAQRAGREPDERQHHTGEERTTLAQVEQGERDRDQSEKSESAPAPAPRRS